MPRRSIWKGSFVDAFLLRMKKKTDLLLNRNSLIAPYEFTMEKLLFVVRSLKEKLVLNLESLLLHGNEDFREQILNREEKRKKSQNKAHMARKGNPILVRSNFLVRISTVVFLLIIVVTFCPVLGLDWSLIWVKLKSMVLFRSLRFIFFRLLGWEWGGPWILLLGLVSGLGESALHMQDPAGGQPAANPAAEQPANVPSGASTSGWRSFEEGVLLEPMPSSGESSEASVNQQPWIPELHPPLLDDNTRRAELADRLQVNWWGIAYNEQILGSFLHRQLQIEKHIEAALVAEGYDREVLFAKRHEIRGWIFYPNGRALSEGAYASHLTQILNLGTRQSVPYRRIIQAIRNSDLFL